MLIFCLKQIKIFKISKKIESQTKSDLNCQKYRCFSIFQGLTSSLVVEYSAVGHTRLYLSLLVYYLNLCRIALSLHEISTWCFDHIKIWAVGQLIMWHISRCRPQVWLWQRPLCVYL